MQGQALKDLLDTYKNDRGPLNKFLKKEHLVITEVKKKAAHLLSNETEMKPTFSNKTGNETSMVEIEAEIITLFAPTRLLPIDQALINFVCGFITNLTTTAGIHAAVKLLNEINDQVSLWEHQNNDDCISEDWYKLKDGAIESLSPKFAQMDADLATVMSQIRPRVEIFNLILTLEKYNLFSSEIMQRIAKTEGHSCWRSEKEMQDMIQILHECNLLNPERLIKYIESFSGFKNSDGNDHIFPIIEVLHANKFFNQKFFDAFFNTKNSLNNYYLEQIFTRLNEYNLLDEEIAYTLLAKSPLPNSLSVTLLQASSSSLTKPVVYALLNLNTLEIPFDSLTPKETQTLLPHILKTITSSANSIEKTGQNLNNTASAFRSAIENSQARRQTDSAPEQYSNLA